MAKSQKVTVLAIAFILGMGVGSRWTETATTAGGEKEKATPATRKDALPPGAIARLGKAELPKKEVNGFVAFLPDNKTVATSGRGRRLTLWNARTGAEIRSWGCRSVGAISPDGKKAAFKNEGKDTMIRVWDLEADKEICQVEGMAWNDAYVFSPDSRHLAVGGGTPKHRRDDPPLRLVEVPSGKEVGRFGIRLPINHLEFSHDGKWLATEKYAGVEPVLQLWEVATGKELRSFSSGYNLPLSLSALSFSPDKKYLAASGQSVYLWDPNTGKQQWRIHHGDPTIGNLPVVGARATVFSPNGKMLAVGAICEDEITKRFDVKATIYLLEAATGRERAHFVGGNLINRVAFSPDGRMLASTWRYGEYAPLVWDVTGQILTKGPPLTPKELDACWSDLGRREPFKEGWVDMRATDAATAWKAICALAGRPDQALPMLKKRLPANGLGAKRFAQLLNELGSEDFPTREKASDEVLKAGPAVKPFLQNALASKLPVEAKKRIEALLGKPGEPGALITEEIRWLRAFEVLEFIGSPDARRLLESQAQGPAESQLTTDAQAAVVRLAKQPLK